MDVIKFKKFNEEAKAPLRAHPTDAGMDLSAAEDYRIEAGDDEIVSLGVGFEVPEGYMLMLAPRSSLFKNKGLMLVNSVGIIDADYRGEVKAHLVNLKPGACVIEEGERLVQAIIVPIVTPQPLEVTELNKTKRGTGGFGSTGA